MRNKTLMVLGVVALLLAVAPASRAQLNSNTAVVNLNAVLAESLTVSTGSPTINFAFAAAGGVSNGSGPATIVTTWALTSARTNVSVYAYFVAPAAALTDGAGSNIASSRVQGSVNGGAFGAFTNNTAFGVAHGITVRSTAITAANANNSAAPASDTLDLRIDTTGLGLPAGTYTGQITVQARAI